MIADSNDEATNTNTATTWLASSRFAPIDASSRGMQFQRWTYPLYQAAMLHDAPIEVLEQLVD